MQLLSLGLMPYQQAWDIQREIFQAVIAGREDDTLILVEHPHVYTFGRGADASNFIASDEKLREIGAEIESGQFQFKAELEDIHMNIEAELTRRIAADPSFGCRFYRALAIFLSDRLRAATRYRGLPPGEADRMRLDGDEALDDELDGNVLDGVSLAGARFDRLMKTMLGAEAR